MKSSILPRRFDGDLILEQLHLVSFEQFVFPAVTFNNELLFFLNYKENLIRVLTYRMTADRVIKAMGHDKMFVLALLCNIDIAMEKSFMRPSRMSKPENFVKKIKMWQLDGWFANQTASWNIHYQPEFKEVITKRGFGFVFNLLPEDLLFTEK
jgi:hypothetical protein